MIDTQDLASFRWATVTDTDPIEIKVDGDTAPLALIPDSLIDPLLLSVGDRVRVELSLRKCVIHGKSNGASSLGYQYGETIIYENSSSFTKASYPGLRAVRVRLVGGGGGGGSANATGGGVHSSGSGGGGGGYAEGFVPANLMGSSVTVTVGAGGSADTEGGTSSFGSFVSAGGGKPGNTNVTSALTLGATGGDGGVGIAGDLLLQGGPGGNGHGGATLGIGGVGGDSRLGGGGRGYYTGSNGGGGSIPPTSGYGGGGGGAAANQSSPARAGATGADGVVIVELYY